MYLHAADRSERPSANGLRLSTLEWLGGAVALLTPVALVALVMAGSSPSTPARARPEALTSASFVPPAEEPLPDREATHELPEGVEPPEALTPGPPARATTPPRRARARVERGPRAERSVAAELDSLSARAAELSGTD